MSALRVLINEKPYDISPPFTNRELHTIKQVAGVRGGEMFDALDAGDNDVLVALAFIAVVRGGTQRPTLDELWDMEAGAITVEADEDVPDPTSAASAAPGSPETIPDVHGSPRSEVLSDSPPLTLAT